MQLLSLFGAKHYKIRPFLCSNHDALILSVLVIVSHVMQLRNKHAKQSYETKITSWVCAENGRSVKYIVKSLLRRCFSHAVLV